MDQENNKENEKALPIVRPTELIGVSSGVANVCKEIVTKTAMMVKNKKYVCVEGWEAIALAHGCHVGSGESERVYDKSEHIGWKANAYIRNGNGKIIGQGEGFVGKDEKHWSAALEYACRSMAQTRAISKACRVMFAHIVIMMNADLKTTPAEEIIDVNNNPMSIDPNKKKEDEKEKADLIRQIKLLREECDRTGITFDQSQFEFLDDLENREIIHLKECLKKMKCQISGVMPNKTK